MKKVTVVGVGALGSHFVQFLRSEDVEFKLIDFDKVEQKNVLSQFHGKPNVGKLKVQAMASNFALLWGIKVGTVPHKLTDVNDDAILAGSDLIVDCLDNAEARRLVQGFARRSHTPCLHGAVDGEGSFGRVVWDENFVIDSGSAPGTPTCEDGENLPFIASVASYLARSAQAFLRKEVRNGFQISPGGVVLTRQPLDKKPGQC
jgi:molybdopterin/thiamine biosynthesis adenylyltransferase